MLMDETWARQLTLGLRIDGIWVDDIVELGIDRS